MLWTLSVRVNASAAPCGAGPAGLAAVCTGTVALPPGTRAQPPPVCAHTHEGCFEGVREPLRGQHPVLAEACRRTVLGTEQPRHPVHTHWGGAGREPAAGPRCGLAAWAPGEDPAGGMAGTPPTGAARAPADSHLCARWGQTAVSRAGARAGSGDTQDMSKSADPKPSLPCVRRPEAVRVLAICGSDLACCRGSRGGFLLASPLGERGSRPAPQRLGGRSAGWGAALGSPGCNPAGSF